MGGGVRGSNQRHEAALQSVRRLTALEPTVVACGFRSDVDLTPVAPECWVLFPNRCLQAALRTRSTGRRGPALRTTIDEATEHLVVNASETVLGTVAALCGPGLSQQRIADRWGYATPSAVWRVLRR
jgi:hypothetical protein